MKIANKISLSFFAVALILTSIAASIFYSIAKGSLRKSICNNLATACCFRSDHIKTYLEMLEISVGQLSKSVVLENFLLINGKENPQQGKVLPQQGEAFEQAMKRLKRTKEVNPAISEFLLLDKTGKVVASSNESSIGLDYSTDAFFLGGQKKTYIKDVYYSEPHKDYLMAVSAPLLDSQSGEFLGVLVSRVRLTDLNNITASKIGMGKTGEIYIVNKYGLMITPSRFKEDAVLKQKVDTQNVRGAWLHKDIEHLLSQDKLVDVFSNYRGVQVLGAHEYIPQMQWAVLAEIEEKEAFAPLAKLRLTFFLIFIIVPIAAWLLGIFLAKLIIGPLHNLHKGTEIIGSGNLDYKVGTNAKDEVGQLSRAFNAMTTNLKTSTTSIDNLNKEIAERKKAEEVLRESEERYRIQFEQTIDALFLADTQTGILLECNRAAMELIGREKSEMVGQHQRILHPSEEWGGKFSKSFEQHIAGETFIETKVIKKSGEIRDVAIKASTFDLKGKKVILAIFRDITESKRVEEKLFHFQKALESATDAISMSTPDGRHYFENEAFTKLFGVSVSEVEGASLSPATVYADEKVGRKVFDIIMRGDSFVGEVKMLDKDRNEKDILQRAYSIKDKEGKVVGLVGIHTDITELKKAEEDLKLAYEELKNTQGQLVQSAKMVSVGQLAGGVAHEINNPLTGVLNNVQLVKMMAEQKKDFSMDDFKDLLNTIEESSKRCVKITQSLLSFSRASKGVYQSLSLNEIVERVIVLIEYELRLQNITIQKELSPESPKVYGDPQLVEQSIFDIINNAKWAVQEKSGKEGGSITLKTEYGPLRKEAILYISDTGVGIAKEYLDRIFEPFFTTKPVGEGTGLGLSIVYSIIREHKGNIQVESEVGKGTTFKISLPAGGLH